MRYFCALLLLPIFAMTAWGLSLRPVSDLELAATADIIVVGAVTAVSSQPAKKEYLAGEGRATIAVERAIAGNPGKTLDIHFPTPPRTHGMAWGLTLKKGERRLFILRLAGDGYRVGSPLGLQPVDAADRFARLVKEIPVRVTLASPVGMTVGKPVTVSVTVSNCGTLPVEYRETTLLAHGEKTPHAINFTPAQRKPKPENPGVRIEPGETHAVTLTFTPGEPASEHPLTRPLRIRCRASVWMKIIDPETAKAPFSVENLPVTQGFYAAAPWVPVELRPR